MSDRAATSAPTLVPRLAAVGLLVVALGGVAVVLWQHNLRLDQLIAEQAKAATTLDAVLGEVTRFRLEQSAGSKGPHALLEKLRTYAPLLANARVTEPDYRNAQKEMDSILRAFGTLGKDAWGPVQERLAERKPAQDFDEIKWLLEASLRLDQAATVPMLKEVLLGRRLPSPRLRWYAAEMLTRADRQVAQATLRQILLTETFRGVDPDRASHYGGGALDPAALASTGFNNFVSAYVRAGDDKLDETLLMVMKRAGHDALTVQECVKVLGERRCAAAVSSIEQLFQKPPLQIENPLFLNHCLNALVAIQGKDAKPFLEAALAKASSDIVSKNIQFLLQKIDSGQLGAGSGPAPTAATIPAADQRK